MLFVPVFAENETITGQDAGLTDLSGPAITGSTVLPTTTGTVEPTEVPTTQPTTVIKTEETIEPTTVPSNEGITGEPTTVPTTEVVTPGPVITPLVTESPAVPPVGDTPGLNETPDQMVPVITPGEQPVVNPDGNLTPVNGPETNLTVISPDPGPVNITSGLFDNATITQDLNETPCTEGSNETVTGLHGNKCHG